jgi:hypothetical protein
MRKIGVVLVAVVALFLWSSRAPRPARGEPTSVVFPLKLDGKSWQPQIVGVPGKKVGIGKVKDKNVTAVLQDTLPDFARDFLDLDPSGRFFLYYDSQMNWRVATNPNGDATTALHGQVSNDGMAWMFGEYTLPMAAGTGDVFVTGKVKFEKGAPGVYVPKAVKGVFYFSSTDIDTGLILKFKTLKPVV